MQTQADLPNMQTRAELVTYPVPNRSARVLVGYRGGRFFLSADAGGTVRDWSVPFPLPTLSQSDLFDELRTLGLTPSAVFDGPIQRRGAALLRVALVLWLQSCPDRSTLPTSISLDRTSVAALYWGESRPADWCLPEIVGSHGLLCPPHPAALPNPNVYRFNL